MTCVDCGSTVGWDCTCNRHVCPCGAEFSDAELSPENAQTQMLCPTCWELFQQAEAKGGKR